MKIPYKTKIALFVAILLWASAFVGIREGLKEYSPEGLALLRYLIASVFIGIVYFRLPARNHIPYKDICALLIIGALGIGAYSITLNYGELVISSGMASFIISQSPIITTICAMIFLGERLNFLRVMGFLISVMGVVLIAFGEVGGFKWNASITYILLATFLGGCYSILQKPFLKKYHAIEATTYVIWGGTLFLLMYTPKLHHDLLGASVVTTLTITYLGIFPAAIGYIGWNYALAEIPASRAVSFLYFMPFLAMILGWVLLGEVPILLSVGGGIVAMLGVWLVNQSYHKQRLVTEKITTA